MAEYTNVERPFLDKLRQLDWQVHDLGFGIPQDPKTSFRSSFREVVLEEVFKNAVRRINRTERGVEWLTDKQLADICEEVAGHTTLNLHEANKRIHHLLLGDADNKIKVAKNEVTGEEYPVVKLIDFDRWQDNDFRAINQFRVDTPGGTKNHIRPDIVLFVNGLPLVVVECKDTEYSEPLSECFIQLQRYQNRRHDDDDIVELKEGEERLFHFNLFSILTYDKEARVGTVSAEFEHYLNWKDIFPEEYKTIPIGSKEEAGRQDVVIHGMLNREILLDILRHFTIFMEVGKGKEVKIAPRYQQYRAVGKIIQRLRNGATPAERSGVVWHTQGSGKSLTMVFLVRKLRSQPDLKDYKVIMVNDRQDLERQLTNTATLTGEAPKVVSSRSQLRPILGTDSSDLSMVMIHKFVEEEIKHSEALKKALKDKEEVPEFKPFELVNPSERILILIDEAHRTQRGNETGDSMSDNLFLAFPQSTKIAFTGTPLLTSRHKHLTHERFGSFVDTYKIRQSVEDRATLDILYIGKTSKDSLSDAEAFQAEFEDMFRERTPQEVEEIKKRYGNMVAYLENKERLKKIADDIVQHYVDEILVNGFKAQVVAVSVLAACRYRFILEKSLKARLALEQAKPEAERDEALIRQLEFVKVAAVVSSTGNNEDPIITKARKEAQELDAVESFKKDFDFDKPDTGVAILCVCDRLLTGFDAPIEQVMYLDKSMREHDLLQAIARTNRTKQGKNHGIVVDYIGVAQNLKEALGLYAGDKKEDEEALSEFLQYFRDINKEVPVLEARYNRMVHLFEDNKINGIEAFFYQRMADKKAEWELAETVITEAGRPEFRAQFDTYLRAFYDSLDVLFNTDAAKQYWLPAKRMGYLYMRIRNRYRDETLDLKWAAAKIRKLIDKYLVSEGVDPKVPPVELLSPGFPREIIRLQDNRAKASEMEHAIRRHIKVNFDKDPALYQQFKDKLESIIQRFQNNWDAMADELKNFIADDISVGRAGQVEEGMETYELPFLDLVLVQAFGTTEVDEKKKGIAKGVVIDVVEALQETIDIVNFWKKEAQVKALRGKIDDILMICDAPEIADKGEKITTEILNLARKRHDDLIKNKDG